MMIPANILELLCCPICNARLEAHGEGVVCQGPEVHSFPVEEGFATFAKPDPGKYNETYAAQYAGLWAYGYETLHLGLNEPLYRTVSSLVSECLAGTKVVAGMPVIVDSGCGVGRVAADCAALAPAGRVLGFDGSLAMLALARSIACGDTPVKVSLEKFGYGTLSVPARALTNLFLARADVENLPLADGSANLVLSVNIVDRLLHGPERALPECRRILQPGGRLVFTDPLNWTDVWLWERYGSRDKILTFIRGCGFRIDIWFDQLIYREILDRRGAIEEFPTLVVLGTAIG